MKGRSGKAAHKPGGKLTWHVIKLWDSTGGTLIPFLFRIPVNELNEDMTESSTVIHDIKLKRIFKMLQHRFRT